MLIHEMLNYLRDNKLKERVLVSYDDDAVSLSLKESILRPILNDYEAKGEYRFFEAQDRYELGIGEVKAQNDKALMSLQAELSLQIFDRINLFQNDVVFSIEESSNGNFDIKTGFIKSYEIKAKKITGGLKRKPFVMWAGQRWQII